MYKVVYRKTDGRVVGCYPYKTWTETVYYYKETNEEGEETERQIPQSDITKYAVEKIRTETVQKATEIFYNKETCNIADMENVPACNNNQYLVYINGTLTVKTDNTAKIAELKRKLAETDYKAIKYAEGLLSEAEYAPIKAQRQAWREEINTLGG